MGRTKLANQAASLAMTGKAVSESESENRRIRVSQAQEMKQAREPPNRSINRTRVPTSGYPFDHSGPVISGVRRQDIGGSDTTRQAMLRNRDQVSHREDTYLLASHYSILPVPLISALITDTAFSRSSLSSVAQR